MLDTHKLAARPLSFEDLLVNAGFDHPSIKKEAQTLLRTEISRRPALWGIKDGIVHLTSASVLSCPKSAAGMEELLRSKWPQTVSAEVLCSLYATAPSDLCALLSENKAFAINGGAIAWDWQESSGITRKRLKTWIDVMERV